MVFSLFSVVFVALFFCGRFIVKIILGIDIGLTGAVAAITEQGDFVAVHDIPLENAVTKGKQRVCCKALHSILLGIISSNTIVACYIESVHAVPSQGVTSMFNFGDSHGAIRCAADIAGLPVVFVSSQKWKKNAGLIGKEKECARVMAIELFPTAPLHLKKHIGRADALLIARFAGL